MRLSNFKLIKIRKLEVPFLVWMVLGSTLIANVIEFPIFGRNMSGWAWVVPLVISIFVIVRRPSRITFPVRLWAPWICIVVFYFLDSGFSYPQRNMMLLSSIIVGMAVSTGTIWEFQIKDFLVFIRCFVYFLFLTVIIRTGLLFTGVLPGTTGFAPQSMTAALLCSIFAVEYSNNRKSSLVHWITGVAMPVIALTRTAIAATGITLPFTFAPLKIKKRFIFLMIVAVLGVTLFYTERVQRKMFYSGAGNIQDIRLSNPDFFTTGRARLWDLMMEEIKAKPWLGHGTNAQEEFIFKYVGFYGQPHNDWIRLLFDYGCLGTFVFALCLVLQTFHAWSKTRGTTGGTRILFYAGASSFLPFVLFMFTDNIVLYVSFFGNLHFAILGMAYGSLKTSMRDAAWYQYQAHLSSLYKINDSSKT
jgi:O-antigen ligase